MSIPFWFGYKWIIYGFGYKFSALLLKPNKKKEDNEKIQVLYVGEKPQRIIPGKTYAVG